MVGSSCGVSGATGSTALFLRRQGFIWSSQMSLAADVDDRVCSAALAAFIARSSTCITHQGYMDVPLRFLSHAASL